MLIIFINLEKKGGKKKGKKSKEAAAAALEQRSALLTHMSSLSLTGSNRCLYPNCTCKYFITGFSKAECYGCSHSAVYHSKTKQEHSDHEVIQLLTKKPMSAEAAAIRAAPEQLAQTVLSKLPAEALEEPAPVNTNH